MRYLSTTAPPSPGGDSAVLFAFQIFALSGFAIAQPVYAWISAQPEFLVAHGAGWPELILLTIALSLLVPGLFLLLSQLFQLFGKRTLATVRIALICLLVAILAIQFFTAIPTWVALSLALCLGLAGGMLYRLSLFMRNVLSVAALAAAVFPLVFLFGEPVRPMLLEQSGRALSAAVKDIADEIPETPVVLIVLDELPVSTLLNNDGEIDERRFPNFARLANHSTWYPRATSVHRGTTQSIPAILTGNLPPPEAPTAQWQNYQDNLFIWAARNYPDELFIHESLTGLCPISICDRDSRLWTMAVFIQDIGILLGWRLLPETLATRWLPSIDATWNQFAEGRGLPARLKPENPATAGGSRYWYNRPELWRRATPEMGTGFHYLHILFPHVPFQYLPDGSRYRDTLNPQGYRRVQNVPDHNVLELLRHMAQTRFLDQLIGEMLDHLMALEQWDDILLIVTADHGRSFIPDSNWRIVDQHNVTEVLGIPLFIKYPGQQSGATDTYLASQIDIARTIADSAGRPLHWSPQGNSLAETSRSPRDHVIFSCGEQLSCNDFFLQRSDEQKIVRLDSSSFQQTHSANLDWRHEQIEYHSELDLDMPTSPASNLLQQQTHQLNIAANTTTGEITLFSKEIYTDVYPGFWVPALVSGYAHGPDIEPGDLLLIAINGMTAGIARVESTESGQQVFGALLPASVFERGDNTVEIFRVLWQNESEPSLEPLTVK